MNFPRLSNKEYIILDLLRSGGEFYGLQMVKASDGALKRGTIYVTLNRMEEKGYIKSRAQEDPSVPGMPRRMYIITGVGLGLLCAIEQAEASISAEGALNG